MNLFHTFWSYKHVKVTVAQSCLTLQPHGLYSPWNSPGQNTKVGSLSLLQGIFPTQGSNPGLLHCRQILYQLSHKGSPRILEWVAYPFSSRSSRPRNGTRISCIAGRFFTNWAIREAPYIWCVYIYIYTHTHIYTPQAYIRYLKTWKWIMWSWKIVKRGKEMRQRIVTYIIIKNWQRRELVDIVMLHIYPSTK